MQTNGLNHQQKQTRHWPSGNSQVVGFNNDNIGSSNTTQIDKINSPDSSTIISDKRALKESASQQVQNLSLDSATINQNFIDRHVLTENEVLPNLEQNSNKPWANRYSRSLKSSLEYKFRVYCSLNYYGDGCTTFCRARDDQFGHYNCSSTGQKVCLDGWEGVDCDKAKCRSGCNQLHGYCEKPNTCECRPGWTGSRCDECLTYPGCQNGYCLTSWQCICHRNWGGVLCDQDLNFCGSHDPCKNNGTCQNIAPGKYKCHCQTGFAGIDCGLNSISNSNSNSNSNLFPAHPETILNHQSKVGCPVNSCLNGGICVGYTMEKSENIQPVENSAPNNNNTSLDSILYDSSGATETMLASELDTLDNNRYYKCECPNGWFGDYCQWVDPNPTIANVDSGHLQPVSTETVDVSFDNQQNMFSGKTILNNNQSVESVNQENKFISYIENNQVPIGSQHVEMRHLISWVLIATISGVFLACLLIVWCCLIVIERNKFSFIQMNIIRNGDCNLQQQQQYHSQEGFSSRLKRVHEKIRDSFRRSSSTSRIKPETKLSIENVLKPPPSYEESSIYCHNKLELNSSPSSILCDIKLSDKNKESNEDNSLVNREDFEQQNNQSKHQSEAIENSLDAITKTNLQPSISTNINCPRHGHLLRQKQLEKDYHYLNYGHQIWAGNESTYITIEGRSTKRLTQQHH